MLSDIRLSTEQLPQRDRRVADRNRATRKMQCPTEYFDSFGQIVLGLNAPRGLNAVSNGLLYIGVVIPCRRRVADPNQHHPKPEPNIRERDTDRASIHETALHRA